jgi:hypothetical protein
MARQSATAESAAASNLPGGGERAAQSRAGQRAQHLPALWAALDKPELAQARNVVAIGADAWMDAAVALFHSLSDRTRLTISRHLARGQARVADVLGELRLAQSTVSTSTRA